MNKRIPLLLGLLLILFTVWMQTTSIKFVHHWRTQLENNAYDFQLRTKLATHKNLLDSAVAIVDIDDKSLGSIGRWPWSRATVADLLTNITHAGAAVVAFDITFPESEKNIATVVFDKIHQTTPALDTLLTPAIQTIQPLFDDDSKFADSLKKVDSVLAISFLPKNYLQNALSPPLLTLKTVKEKSLGFYNAHGVINNIPQLQQAATGVGFINVFPDEDGVIRRVPLLIRYQEGLYPSLALKAAQLYLLSNIQLVTASYNDLPRVEGVQLGNYVIPTDAAGSVIIPYQGRSYTFPYYSAVDVLNHKIPENAFTGKIVFIGTSATGLADLKATSVQNIFPGVEIQASIADGILKHHFSIKPDWALGVEVVITLIIGILCAFTFPYFGPNVLTLLIILIPLCLTLGNAWVWDKTGLIISVLTPSLLVILLGMTNIIYGYFFETKRRVQLKEMFGQYVPEGHIDEMLQSKGDYGLYGEEREMTVLFADIRDFTMISEKLHASQLKELLNDVFTPMTEIIFKYRGTIDKYIGDLIMAFWGAPLKDSRHIAHALNAAIDMQATLDLLRSDFINKNLPVIHMGIGLNTGVMSVGDMGSVFRRNYTVIGDAVNLASRVEGLTKHYGVNILCTEHCIKDQNAFVFRELDRVRVKGKSHPVAIFEVVCKKSQLSEEKKAELLLSEVALQHYYQQQWALAHQAFTELAMKYAHVKLYGLYLERVKNFIKEPPSPEWDGVFVHTHK